MRSGMVKDTGKRLPAADASDPRERGGLGVRAVLDLSQFALERLWQHRLLVLWTLIGLTAAAALAISLILYVDSVNSGLLTDHLSQPSFAFRYRYLGVWNGAISRDSYQTADEHLRGAFVETVGLPTDQLAAYIGGGIWTASADAYNLGSLTIGTLSGADGLIEITAGAWNASMPLDDDGTIPVLLSDKLFQTMGVQVGDRLTASRPGGGVVQLRVAALWRPVNTDDPAWMLPPRFFETVILMGADALWAVASANAAPVEEAVWSLIFAGDEVKTSDVPLLVDRIQSGERAAAEILPGIRLEISPIDGLRTFNADVQQLTGQLAITTLPVAGLTLYFVLLVAALLVSRQIKDDALLASRGMTRRAILFVHAWIWGCLACAAVISAAVISPFVVQIVAHTSSFLRFDQEGEALTVVLTSNALMSGAATVLIAASGGMILSWQGTRKKALNNANVRAARAWWQRTYLDVLLFIPAAYMLFTLWRSGGLTTSAQDPFSDPLALFAPTLFALSLTLLFLRAYPFALRLWSSIVQIGRSIPLLMALREITRSIGRYRGALLMTAFTLSLTGFTASMASTLDASLKDTIDYVIGTDVVLIPAADEVTEDETDSSGQQTGITVTGFNTLPAEDLLAIDGVRSVSRVGRYPAQIVLPSERPTGTVLGIDRAGLAAVTRFRRDYSETPLAELMNRLAINRTGVIVSAEFARRYRIAIGQTITVQISALNTWSEISVPVIGMVEYFPTLDPRTGFFLLMSLDVVFETVGSELPHDLWIDAADDADIDAIRRDAAALGYPILEWRDPAQMLQAALRAPLRRGVLGFLSIGFIAALTLTIIGAVIQNTASFRAQLGQIGVLRAMGLSAQAGSAYLFLTQGFAVIGGIAGGTLIGIATTLLFLPVLDFSGGLPPYLVRVAWESITLVYASFGGVLFLVIFATTFIMSRQSLTALVKLGD